MNALLLALALATSPLIRAPSGGGPSVSFTDLVEAKTFRAWYPQNATTSTGAYGNLTVTTSTVTAVTCTATRYGQYVRMRLNSGTAANAIAKIDMNPATANNGFFAPQYGFSLSLVAGVLASNSLPAGRKAFIGAWSGSTAIAGTMVPEPSTNTNVVYFGFDSNQSAWQICSNDGSGTATCNPIGLATSATGMRSWEIATVDGTSYVWTVTRLDADEAVLTGSVTTDLPVVTTPLRFVGWWGNTTNDGGQASMEPAAFYYYLPY